MGAVMVAQASPSLPAEATTNTPAARSARAAGNSALASQPSISAGLVHFHRM